VLLVLSDGRPAGGGNSHEQYGKLHKSIAEAPKFGVDLFGIGICDASVRQFYPRHVVLNDLTMLPRLVMGELKSILLAA
jgi:cobaltochelatase CobT